MLRKKIFFIVLVLLAFGQEAQAQFLWSVTHPDREDNGRFIYSFQCLSCSGDNCTVAGILHDTTGMSKFIPNQHHDFWNSSDGGETWTLQDPNLPVEWAVQNDPWERVQRIDSLNVVAIGASGLVMRSFDAGATWQKQTIGTKQGLTGVHFSDSLTGIITAYSDPVASSVFTTTDGGRHWNSVSLTPTSYPSTYSGATHLCQCHSYGNGKFRIFQIGLGPIYTTTDNFKTVITSKLIIDSTKNQSWNSYYFWDCTFSDSTDDILAYGILHEGTQCAIECSTNGGTSWGNLLTQNDPHSLLYSTQIDRDTILSAGFSDNHILMSIDRGKTWALDTILIDTAIRSDVFSGIEFVKNGAVTIFSGIGSVNFLLHGTVVHSGVKQNQVTLNSNVLIYPNPATTEINIISENILESVYIYDILGRELMRGRTSEQGNAIFNISLLPQGVYNVAISHKGQLIQAGKFTVIAK